MANCRDREEMNMSDEIRKKIEDEVEKVRNLPNPPQNESCTCEWVIRPLLEAAGYEKIEIVSQDRMSGGGIPDYTILPDTEWTWYLEAKAWEKNLENGNDAVQALNYANAQGRRWVVLSNGRQWFLFDNHRTNVEATKRVVAKANIEDPDFIDFMLAVSRHSITSDGLKQYVTTSQVSSALDTQLYDKNSDVVKVIVSKLKKLGIKDVQASDVVNYFSSKLGSPPLSFPIIETVPTSVSLTTSENENTLAQLFNIRDSLDYTKPVSIRFPDGSSSDAPNWIDLARMIVEWLAKRNKLPQLPFCGSERGKRLFLSREKDQIKMSPKEIETPDGPIYLEASTSSKRFVQFLNKLCQVVGEPAEGFVVRWRKRSLAS